MDFWFSENNGHIKCASRWDDQSTTVNVFHRPTSLFLPYTRWIGPELSTSRQKLRITGSRVRMEARFFSILNDASLHSAFHVHFSTVLFWLKTVERDVKPQLIHELQVPYFTVCHMYILFNKWTHAYVRHEKKRTYVAHGWSTDN